MIYLMFLVQMNIKKSIAFDIPAMNKWNLIRNTIPFTLAPPQNEILRYKSDKICIKYI